MSARPYPRLFISAVRKSSGKTLLTVGLAAALRARGESLRLYKKGPDYIDPMWHGAASGTDALNLDPWLMGNEACLSTFLENSFDAGLSLIEGNLGLHDGIELDGRYSSADLARTLSAPILLVVDSTGMNRNVAAVVHGMNTFDPEVRLAGVVLNNVRSSRQEQKQIAAIEQYCGLPVVGSLPGLEEAILMERHLGLITPHEEGEFTTVVQTMGKLIGEHINLDRIRELAAKAPPLDAPESPAQNIPENEAGPVIAVARDPAFCFYYQQNLEALKRAGARLVFFNTLEEPSLPNADGLYIAGGFPESFLEQLEGNASLRREIAGKIEAGLPAYAECGGMMMLTRAIIHGGRAYEMAGVIPAEVEITRRPVGYGYVELAPGGSQSWLAVDREIRAHEFHYSHLVNLPPETAYIYRVNRGAGISEGRDGLIHKNLIASYAHLHATTLPGWATDFVAAAENHRRG